MKREQIKQAAKDFIEKNGSDFDLSKGWNCALIFRLLYLVDDWFPSNVNKYGWLSFEDLIKVKEEIVKAINPKNH